MFRTAVRPRGHRQARPRVEGLEDRKLLYATVGGAWAKPVRVTYSFAPDGTSIGGDSSNLFATMASRGIVAATWQQQFTKAFAVWQAVANINFAQVSDDGSAFGTSGNQQGDSRFGDIRIGGDALGQGILANAFYPPPINGGTVAGDIVIASGIGWNVGSTYDLETVAIHEVGHALGMDHSTISTADMYATYNATKQSLAGDDVSGIQAVYGARPQDAASNNTSSTAADITGQLDAQGKMSIPNLGMVTSSDVDYYKVTAPANTTGTLVVNMQSTSLSLLSPKVTLYNSAMQALGTAGTAGSFSATAGLTINGVAAGQVFYIKCAAANTAGGGNGAFGLQVNFGSGTLSSIAPPNTTVASQPDTGGGSASQTTGSGGGLLGGVLGAVTNVVSGLLSVLHIGNLVGYGDSLTARELAETHHHHRSSPSGPTADVPVALGPHHGSHHHGAGVNHRGTSHPRPTIAAGHHGRRLPAHTPAGGALTSRAGHRSV